MYVCNVCTYVCMYDLNVMYVCNVCKGCHVCNVCMYACM